MSSENWKFKAKKDVKTKVATNCNDCNNPIYPGSFARRFVYQKMPEQQFKVVHICEDCEKYWRTKEPKI